MQTLCWGRRQPFVTLMCGHDKENHQSLYKTHPARRATNCSAPHTKAMAGSPQNATSHPLDLHNATCISQWKEYHSLPWGTIDGKSVVAVRCHRCWKPLSFGLCVRWINIITYKYTGTCYGLQDIHRKMDETTHLHTEWMFTSPSVTLGHQTHFVHLIR